MNYTCIRAHRELMHNGYCNLDKELKASYQQLQAELDDEKEVQATLIQVMHAQSLKPKELVGYCRARRQASCIASYRNCITQ